MCRHNLKTSLLHYHGLSFAKFSLTMQYDLSVLQPPITLFHNPSTATMVYLGFFIPTPQCGPKSKDICFASLKKKPTLSNKFGFWTIFPSNKLSQIISRLKQWLYTVYGYLVDQLLCQGTVGWLLPALFNAVLTWSSSSGWSWLLWFDWNDTFRTSVWNISWVFQFSMGSTGVGQKIGSFLMCGA